MQTRRIAHRIAHREDPAAARVLGIDGGGSKTTVLIADGTGRVLARGEAGCSNHHVVGWVGAEAALAQAVRRAVSAAKRRHLLHAKAALPMDCACIGVAGFDPRSFARRWQTMLARLRVTKNWLTVIDAELLLAAGTPDRIGIGLVAGTGSICFGRNGAGKTARAGGWGHLLGDEGSGYHLGVRALHLALSTLDGRERANGLARAVMKHLGARTGTDVVRFAYDGRRRKADFAALAPLVLDRASSGDAHARALVGRGASDLANMVRAVAKQLGFRRTKLALGGGLMVRPRVLRGAVLKNLGKEASSFAIVAEPARGAIRLALEALGLA